MYGSKIEYHLSELEGALDPSDPYHSLPRLEPGELRLLDIGCGIGQSLVALSADCSLHPDAGLPVGLDIDSEALAYGERTYPGIRYVHGRAEGLPFSDAAFDLVLSRVTLPYTDLPRALAEAHRVLRPGGRLWCTLHPLARASEQLREAVRARRFKGIVFRLLVIANGALFHVTGRVAKLPTGRRRETFQTALGMERALRRAGFVDVHIDAVGRPFVVTARHKAS